MSHKSSTLAPSYPSRFIHTLVQHLYVDSYIRTDIAWFDAFYMLEITESRDRASRHLSQKFTPSIEHGAHAYAIPVLFHLVTFHHRETHLLTYFLSLLFLNSFASLVRSSLSFPLSYRAARCFRGFDMAEERPLNLRAITRLFFFFQCLFHELLFFFNSKKRIALEIN